MPLHCKDCNAPLFKRADGAVSEEGRKAPAAGAPAYTGTKRRAGETQTPPAPPPTQGKPRREHLIDRRIFGGKKKDETAGAKT